MPVPQCGCRCLELDLLFASCILRAIMGNTQHAAQSTCGEGRCDLRSHANSPIFCWGPILRELGMLWGMQTRLWSWFSPRMYVVALACYWLPQCCKVLKRVPSHWFQVFLSHEHCVARCKSHEEEYQWQHEDVLTRGDPFVQSIGTFLLPHYHLLNRGCSNWGCWRTTLEGWHTSMVCWWRSSNLAACQAPWISSRRTHHLSCSQIL